MWEALWVKGKEFLALQPQWPIARLVQTDSTARVYHAPVRVLAISVGPGCFSPSGLGGDPEGRREGTAAPPWQAR